MLTDQQYLDCLRQLCTIESVAGVDVSDPAPYGAGSAAALDYALSLCRSFGFRTRLCGDHRCGWAEIGQGEEIVGILVHLDVVPAGSGWDYPPFDLTEAGERVYGRGVIDDKGPAMACIFAMKDLLDAGVPLRRRVRIIFGQSEETGVWDDMEYYKLHEELPAFGFTPDADFPAIYGEKRILCLELSMPKQQTGLEDIRGGSASNMVADWCRASVASTGEILETAGKAAHASTPEDGVNAITAMMSRLESLIPDSPLVRFYQTCIGENLHGERLGCALEDPESGKLTMNAGTIAVREDQVVLTLDIREPVTFPDTAVLEPVRRAADAFGMSVTVTENTPPVYMDKDGPVITRLLEVYRSLTGDDSEPAVIGGGTYARAMENIVAFGPMLPGRELTEHQKNEYMLKSDLLLIRKIYRSAVRALAE